MRISTLDEYGLRCMMQLAQTGSNGSLTIAEIAEKEGLSLAYVAKLMNLLRKAGLVHSERGRLGGYTLAQPATEISVARVMNTLGGPTWEAGSCQRFTGLQEICVHTTGCSIRSLWGTLDRLVARFLENVSLADLVGDEVATTSRLRSQMEMALSLSTHAAQGRAHSPLVSPAMKS